MMAGFPAAGRSIVPPEKAEIGGHDKFSDPAFASETSGPMGSMRDYAQHIKAEVTAGLTETETLSLLRSTADRAKGEAQQALRSLATEGKDGPVVETSPSHKMVPNGGQATRAAGY
jgi:hypothetical protein